MKNNSQHQEIALITKIHEKALKTILNAYSGYIEPDQHIAKEEQEAIEKECELLKKRFVQTLLDSLEYAKQARAGKRYDKQRLAMYNPKQAKLRSKIQSVFPLGGNAWVLDGLVIAHQRAGIKTLYGLTGSSGAIIDVLNSAASLNLGAENPWLLMMDRYEDFWGQKDNICSPYHPGTRHGFALESFSRLYPARKVQPSLAVHSEASGTIVDSIAIESSLAYVDKRNTGKNGLTRILAVDGTWAGDYGSAREGTGFNVDEFQKRRAGKNLYVDRCLPAPSKEQGKRFLHILKQKIAAQTVGGLYLEPDIIGDLGIIVSDREVLVEAKKILGKEKLPIILDCVQQLGRTGSYWGENVDAIFSDYPYLIMTTAKSASNGQPFGYTIMPKEIADSAHPVSQVTTNQMNGPLFRALVVSEVFKNKEFQSWVKQKSQTIARVAAEYGVEESVMGLRGKYLNRGVYVKNNDMVKLMQIALLIEDGVLVGALPQSLRYQPMMLELSETNELVAHLIFHRLQKIQRGEISPDVKRAYEQMKKLSSGLARENTTK